MKINKERIIHLLQIVIKVLILPVMCAISYGTKSYVPMVLGLAALIMLFGISRIKLIDRRFEGSEEERQNYRRIVIRSIILAPIIVIVFVTIVVIISLNS